MQLNIILHATYLALIGGILGRLGNLAPLGLVILCLSLSYPAFKIYMKMGVRCTARNVHELQGKHIEQVGP